MNSLLPLSARGKQHGCKKQFIFISQGLFFAAWYYVTCSIHLEKRLKLLIVIKNDFEIRIEKLFSVVFTPALVFRCSSF